MSTDRKRLNSAIQRIAREDPEIRKLLDKFRNSGGKPSESATSGSGAEDRQICCDGSTGSGGTNPGSDTRDPNENPQDGIDPDDPADISDNTTGVTDCATGTPICFVGSDWIPPEGWDGPTDPPLDPSYEEGRIWYFQDSTQTCPEDGCISLGYTKTSAYEDNGMFKAWRTATCDNLSPSSQLTLCCPSEVDNLCGREPTFEEIHETEWPADGCVNLAIKNGKLVGSKYDPENDGSWSAPRDEVELCDAFGNSFTLKASGSIEGGWKSISSQNPDDGYLYDGTGKQIARISESEYSDPAM